MKIEILAIGTELLDGTNTDTNSTWIGKTLRENGAALSRITLAPDNREYLNMLMKERMDECDMLLIMGGLGPTEDDFTKEVVAEVFEKPLYEDKEALSQIEARFAAMNREMADINVQQAMMPICHLIKNISST